MRLNRHDLKHLHFILSLDIRECTNKLEDDIPNEKVGKIASRMESDRRLLERIDHEFHLHPEWQ